MLSESTKKAFRAALASKGLHGFSEELIAAIDANGSGPAADVAALAATTDITAVPGSFADLAAVRTYLAGANVIPNIESRLDGVEGKINAILTALKNAGMMS